MDNEKETYYGEWWTAPASADNGKLIMVTGRKDVEKFRKNTKYSIRVEISWKYEGDGSGMPLLKDSELMADVTDRLQHAFKKDPVAVLTGIYTGDNERNWIFYTLSTHIFGRKLNESLESLPLLPLEIKCVNDSDWKEYEEMNQLAVESDE